MVQKQFSHPKRDEPTGTACYGTKVLILQKSIYVIRLASLKKLALYPPSDGAFPLNAIIEAGKLRTIESRLFGLFMTLASCSALAESYVSC